MRDQEACAARLACEDHIILGLQNVIKSLTMQCVEQQDVIEDQRPALKLVEQLRIELSDAKDETKQAKRRLAQSEAACHAAENEARSLRSLIAEADAQVSSWERTLA